MCTCEMAGRDLRHFADPSLRRSQAVIHLFIRYDPFRQILAGSHNANMPRLHSQPPLSVFTNVVFGSTSASANCSCTMGH
ncbi:hypothetical protein D3C81_1806480 [compost metagenome]